MFGITSPKLEANYYRLLDSNMRSDRTTLDITAAMQAEIYENSNTDFRNQYLIRTVALFGTKIYYAKLYQPSASRRMPLMKLSEMYYIAAECLAATNATKAAGYLNTVRTARGITTSLGTSLSESVIRTEIYKEYRKELPVEGQLFYYYKRTNSNTIPIGSTVFNTALYVLPLPQQELDFGN